MELIHKFNELYNLLGKAIVDFEKSLNADLSKYDEQEIDWIKNARIQKFEFCTELMWKTAKLYAESVEEKVYTPKLTIKSLFLLQIIDEETYRQLMDCINDRNLLSHIYKSEMFDSINQKLYNHLSGFKKIFTILGTVTFI